MRFKGRRVEDGGFKLATLTENVEAGLSVVFEKHLTDLVKPLSKVIASQPKRGNFDNAGIHPTSNHLIKQLELVAAPEERKRSEAKALAYVLYS